VSKNPRFTVWHWLAIVAFIGTFIVRTWAGWFEPGVVVRLGDEGKWWFPDWHVSDHALWSHVMWMVDLGFVAGLLLAVVPFFIRPTEKTSTK
jgi:hypothetical protein